MTFESCILNNELLTKKQKQELLEEYQGLVKKYRYTMGDMDAASTAAKQFVGVKEAELTRKKMNTVKDINNYVQVNRKMRLAESKVDALKGKAGIGKFMFGNSYSTAVRGYLEDIYTKVQNVERQHLLGMADVVEKFRSKAAGLSQDTEGFARVVRAVLGDKNVKDEGALADAAAIRKVFDAIHRRYKQAGGIMGKIENYFPQVNNPVLVGRAGFQAWKDFIKPRLDLNKMIDVDTGLPMSMEKLDKLLPDIFESIKTNGLNEIIEKVEKGGQRTGRGGGMASRRAYSRFFHFKDADSFLEYNSRFGHGDSGLFNAMIGHISSMSRDIGIMEEMGPKPESVMQRFSLAMEASGANPQTIRTAQGMYDVLAGRTSFSGELPTWYKVGQNLQDWLRSTLLGSAPVSAMSDSFFGAYASKMNGIPPSKFIANYMKLLNPASDQDRRIAKRIALVSGAASGNSFAHARFSDDAGSRGVMPWLAGFTNRASGLGVMTDAVRQSALMSAMGHMAELKASKVAWADVEPEIKEAFTRWNMNEGDYNNVMKAQAYVADETGADFLRPEDIAEAAQGMPAPDAAAMLKTAEKYGNWIVNIGQEASNEPRLLTRAITTGAALGDARKGTALRMATSSMMMFKSFGITVMLNHFLPALQRTATARGLDRISRIGTLMLGTTLLGAATLQAKQTVAGKTPMEMDSGKFWKAALMQGGGAGVFGDFLFADYSRFNQNFATTLAGPVAGFVSDAARVFGGNFDKALQDGEKSKFFSDLYQFAERNIPAVKLWYTRLLMERMLLDQGERMIDPNFDTRMHRLENKMQKQSGQEWWWKPGDTSPR